MKAIRRNNTLRDLRVRRGLTQQQLACLLGHRSNDRVSHWERGQMAPSLKNLVKLSGIYGVPIDDLVR